MNWVPQKLGQPFVAQAVSYYPAHGLKSSELPLDIPLILPPDDILVLDHFAGKGKQEGETELPEDAAQGKAPTLIHA